MSDVPFAPLLIDGERRSANAGATFPVHSPHTGALASTAAAASSEDCHAAIAAAQRAFPAWEATTFATRRDILLRAAATLKSEEWQKRAAAAMRAEVAMSPAHALFNFVAGFELLASVAGLVNDMKGETFPSTVPGGHVFIQRRAKGVMYVLITASPHPFDRTLSSWSDRRTQRDCRYSAVPWNAPVPLMMYAVATPIVCGNTVVIRPSEFCPYTSYLVVEALHDVRE
jgi:acyl-CoA reductase-like NAD-dependent aldehyde dehydrogenase